MILGIRFPSAGSRDPVVTDVTSLTLSVADKDAGLFAAAAISKSKVVSFLFSRLGYCGKYQGAT